jgi:hypothetical protein
MQRFVAEDWPFKIWFALVAGIWLLVNVLYLWPYASPINDLWAVLLFVSTSAVSCIIMFGIDLILGSLLLSPIYMFQATRNGAPFEPGDVVCILAGRAKGRSVKVYSTWQGNSVRVELGDAERESFQDIYGAHQLQRVWIDQDGS